MEPTTTTEASGDPDENGGRGESRPLQQLLIAGGVALAIGLAAGFVIGWQVEKSRVKSDVKELKARLKAATEAKGAPTEDPAEGPTASRPQGEVTAVSADSVTIKTATGDKVIKLTDSTQIEKASPGTAADVTQGAKLLTKGERTTGPNFNAQEIIVLPSVTDFSGHTVTAVAPGSITTTSSTGTSTFTLSDTTIISKTATAAAGDIVQGSIVLVRTATAQDGTVSAKEIVVLPAGSTFLA